MIRISFATIFLWVSSYLFLSCAQPQKEATELKIIDDIAVSRLDSTLKSFVDKGRVSGASALVMEDGEERYFNAFGSANRESGIQMDRNTLVHIYSMTKPVTGVALMTLYEDGVFDLDDPLSDHLPEYQDMQVFLGFDSLSGEMLLEPANRPITIRDITRHTAGFANSNAELGEVWDRAAARGWDMTITEMSETLASLPLIFHPGERWHYGLCVDVQAALVERLSGETFGKYLRSEVLDPLGMDETRYFVPEPDQDRLAIIYSRGEEGELVKVPDENRRKFNTRKWALEPGGFGLTSTLDDYMKFAQMLVNDGEYKGVRILKPETVRLMKTNHLPETVEDKSWLPSKGRVGFGIDFAVRTEPPANGEENNGVVGEFFWDGAATTLFWVDPANDLTAILFVQLIPFNGSIHKDFRDAVYGKYSVE